jgi:hypothetical protein
LCFVRFGDKKVVGVFVLRFRAAPVQPLPP